MLGNAASIATLILFIIYFVGRGITIHRMRDLERFDIVVKDKMFDYTEHQIVDEFELPNLSPMEDELCSAIIITSVSGIHSFKVYKRELDEDLNVVGKKLFCQREKMVNIGQSVVLYTFLPEAIARYDIEYHLADYRKVTFPIVDNMKSGVISEYIIPHHTFKSVLYYLFR